MPLHIIRHGKRDLVAGLDCSLHDRLPEAKRAAKESVAFNIQTVEDGKLLLACAKEALPKDRKSTRLNSSHLKLSRMPSSA